MKRQKRLLDEATIRRLRAVGCPVPMEEDLPLVPDLIVEVRNPRETVAYDFLRSTEFLLDLRITNHSYGRRGIERVEGSPPWSDEHFTWLGDPRRHMPEKRVYRMPSGREIACELVLNHRFCEEQIEPGESLEGMLLAWSMFTRIPAEYLHGETLPLPIALVDQYKRSHCSLIEVRIDRSATMGTTNVSRRFGGGLDGGRPKERSVFNHTITSQHQESQDGIENPDARNRITESVGVVNLDFQFDRKPNGKLRT